MNEYKTKKSNNEITVYAVSTAFPYRELLLEEVDYSPEIKASLLGSDETITVAEKGGKALLLIPPLNPDRLTSEYLYTFKLTR